MEPTQRQKDIINAAMEIIANYGLQNLSIRHIASSVGIHESTIYSHFKSKDEILEYILDSYRKCADIWCKEFDLKGTSILHKLELYYKKHSLEFIIEPDRAKVYWLGLTNSEGNIFEKVKAIHFSFKAWLCKTIEEGQKNGEIRCDFNSDDLSSIISGNIYLNCRRLAFYNKYNFEKNIPVTWKMLETMLSSKQ